MKLPTRVMRGSARPARVAALLGVERHAAEFEQCERPAVQPGASLAVKHRPAAVDPDQYRGQQHQRQCQRQQGEADADVDAAFDRVAGPSVGEPVREQQPVVASAVEINAPELFLAETCPIEHRHAA